MAATYISSESVTEGHPDKVCDQISDAVLDAYLASDPAARVAVEVLASGNTLHIAGEVTSTAHVDIASVARGVLRRIGYTDPELGFDADGCFILTDLREQSPDIAQGVSRADELGAGDQGIFYGYACDETPTLMPAAIHYAHRLTMAQADARKSGRLPWLRPDGKAQVTFRNDVAGRPAELTSLVCSAQHAPDVSREEMLRGLIEEVVAPVMGRWLTRDTRVLINPTGRFVLGGPAADTGLTGRKLMVDTYGGVGRHGGGAFSGKDATKLDRTAAYMARLIAKTVVAARLASQCEISLAFAIGQVQPEMVGVRLDAEHGVDTDRLAKAIRDVFPLSVSGMIEALDLRRPLFEKTAAYGHFGRESEGFAWERGGPNGRPAEGISVTSRYLEEISQDKARSLQAGLGTATHTAAVRRRLSDLTSVEMLQKVQDNFSAAVGVAMVIVDPRGEPVTKPSGFSNFCQYIRSHPMWRERCYHCDSVGGRTALSTGDPSIYKCHCGLVDFAAPIIMRGEYLGAVICGQVNLRSSETTPDLVDLSGLFPKENSWRDDPDLLKLYEDIREINYEKLRSAAYSLYYIASYIVEESYSNSVNQELYAKNMRLMEESKRRAELERSLREAELQALSYQVNPHFLFNVLNTIGRLALIEGAEETETTVHAFADMMRYVLKKSGSQFVPLATELDHVKNYLFLLRLRLGDRFTFRISVPEEFDNTVCPFMVLQPIVENCINYAIEPRESDGVVDINAFRDGDDVIVDIVDNGDGISAERKQAVLAGVADRDGRKSIGIYNVDSRLRHYFGDDHGLEIVSPFRENRGTLVRIRLPVDYDDAPI